MKKVVLLIILLLPFFVSAKEIEVEFSKCVDGDTAEFIYKKEKIKVRFLAVDTPETKHPTKKEEPFGKEASKYTCDKITNASKILLEYDPGSDELDKYDRHLVWVYVDDTLLQKELVEKGLAKVAYLYGDYIYTSELQATEKIAQENRVGIWGDYKDYTIYYIGGAILLLIILALIINKTKNTTIKKSARKLNTKTTNELKKLIKKL